MILSLEARLEALLFVSAAPVPAPRLSETLGASPAEIEQALAQLDRQLEGRGLRSSLSGVLSEALAGPMGTLATGIRVTSVAVSEGDLAIVAELR